MPRLWGHTACTSIHRASLTGILGIQLGSPEFLVGEVGRSSWRIHLICFWVKRFAWRAEASATGKEDLGLRAWRKSWVWQERISS